MNLQLIEVNNLQLGKDFCEVNAQIQSHNPNYIRPINQEVLDVFDPNKNKQFAHGTAKRWLLKADGKYIGRIAAFVTSKYINKGTDFKVGGMGFFDCIDDQKAADTLLDKAIEWLKSQGMEAVDGPINFGDRDKWWGLMVNGFHKPPMYGMSFNPPYYQALLENYGFKCYYNHFYYSMDVDATMPEKIRERHARFLNKPDYTARHIEKGNIVKYAQHFAKVYNAAWAQHGEAKEISVEQAEKMFKKMKPIIDERMVWFAYYKDEPIAMFINIPDLNEYFREFNGKFGWWQKLRFLYMQKTGACKRVTGLAFGVVPKFQALGIDSFIIQSVANFIQHKGWYTEYEMGWAADWNPKMLNIYRAIGGAESRHMKTYRYIFDTTIHSFEPHPVMEYKVG